MNRPTAKEFNPFYAGYIAAVPDDIFKELNQQLVDFPEFIQTIPKGKENFAYADGKWTIKEVIGHILDTERIMAYRTLRFARNDQQNLPGFEENDYVSHSHYHDRSMQSLAEEFACLRKSNLFLFSSLSSEELLRQGNASGYPVSVRALLYIIAGHLNHHQRVLTERYLND